MMAAIIFAAPMVQRIAKDMAEVVIHAARALVMSSQNSCDIQRANAFFFSVFSMMVSLKSGLVLSFPEFQDFHS